MSAPRVLVVDDEPSMRWTMAEFLRRGGYEPLPAADFDAALALADEGELDAAVIDLILPGRSGLELLGELAGRDAYVPVITITGEPDSPAVAEVVRMGAYDFIPKPVLKEALLKAVAGAVERKRLVDEKRRLERETQRHAEELELRVAERTAELAEAHSFLNLVLDSSTEYAIVATDTGGRITLFNRGAERVFGRAAAEALGQEPCVLCGREGEEEPLRRIFSEGVREADEKGRHQSEARFRRAGGEAFVASLAVTPIRGHGGEIIGHLGIVKDLTAEREAAERLRRMQERLAHHEKIAFLGRAAAQVAHEVKNPLAGLLLYAMHLRGKVADKLSEGELAIIDKMVDTINHLTATADQVLDFARPIKLSPRPVDLNRVMADVLQLLRPQIEAGRIEPRVELDGACGRVVLDEPSIRSALMNLALNAVQAMHGGGALTVRTEAHDGLVDIEIRDEGAGMSEEQVGNIFEPFFTTKSQGLGLGMPFAQKVVEQHGGTVSIESRPGAGTTVRVRLPQNREEGADGTG
ncbi:MAG TPA: ATP-binding protein [Pyrinomonadaceae bacterium]|jgi:PAS domain S-box-containing protein